MRKHFAVIVVLATICLGAGAWAFAQRLGEAQRFGDDVRRGRAEQPGLIDDVTPHRVQIEIIDRGDDRKPPKVIAVPPIARGPVGRYAVAEGDDCTLLVDTTTGSTWILCPAASGRPADVVWLPLRRIDDKDEASLWRRHQEELAKEPPEPKARRRR